MKIRPFVPRWQWVLIAVLAVAATVAVTRDDVAPADAAGGAPDINLLSLGGQKQGFNFCDTIAGGIKTCAAHPGETFTMAIYLDKIGPTAFNNGFGTAHIRLDYSAGLTRVNVPNEWAVGGAGVNMYWDDCFSVSETNLTGSWRTSCTSDGGSPSLWTSNRSQYPDGAMLVTSFTCTSPGPQTITLVNDPTSGTRLLDQASTPHAETPSNTLVVNCAYQLVEDVTGDGFVTGLDFFGVLSAFGDCIPSAPGCNP
jgi:hypothetical protein